MQRKSSSILALSLQGMNYKQSIIFTDTESIPNIFFIPYRLASACFLHILKMK